MGILLFSVNLDLLEIIILQSGAIILGISIHFFLTSRKSMRRTLQSQQPAAQPIPQQSVSNQVLEELKAKFMAELDNKQREMANLRDQLTEIEERSNILSLELDEQKKENRKIKQEAAHATAELKQRPEEKMSYIDQLRVAQDSLVEHNQKISLLLDQIEVIEESERKTQEALRNNELMNNQVMELSRLLQEKERAIHQIRQKENLSKEMAARLDSAYEEFQILQDKLQKLELQLSTSRHTSLDYEDLQESYKRISREHELQRMKISNLTEENLHLSDVLSGVEDRLREADFQNQQLKKRLNYLEELNSDLQQVTDHNKNLETQLKRIGELESKLNMIAEERDALKLRQVDV